MFKKAPDWYKCDSCGADQCKLWLREEMIVCLHCLEKEGLGNNFFERGIEAAIPRLDYTFRSLHSASDRPQRGQYDQEKAGFEAWESWSMAPVFGAAMIVRAHLCGHGPSAVFVVTRGGDPEHLVLPGGHREPGENSQEAAIRETFEETGIIVKDCTRIYAGDDGNGNVCETFVATSVQTPIRIRPEAGHDVLLLAASELTTRPSAFLKYYRNLPLKSFGG